MPSMRESRWIPEVLIAFLQRRPDERYRIEEMITLVATMPELGNPVYGTEGLFYVDVRFDEELVRIHFTHDDHQVVLQDLISRPLA